MCWGEEGGLICPHTAIHQNSSSDHEWHLWAAGVCQATADMASVFIGDPILTCGFDLNYSTKTLKSTRLTSEFSSCSEHCEAIKKISKSPKKISKKMDSKRDRQRKMWQKHSSSELILLVNISSGKITKKTTQCEGRISRHWHMTLLGPIIPQVFLSDALST